MPAVAVSSQAAVERLMPAVKQLSPAEMREVTRPLAECRAPTGQPVGEAAALLQATKGDCPARAARATCRRGAWLRFFTRAASVGHGTSHGARTFWSSSDALRRAERR